ncbi:MAG: hypothetical protein LBR79_03165 [Oscillospiraceae bacterium]|nr:hypothetical protein [Oscillospiraceae bacterium]
MAVLDYKKLIFTNGQAVIKFTALFLNGFGYNVFSPLRFEEGEKRSFNYFET